MLLDGGFEKVIGLDPSLILLRSTKTRLRDRFYPVRGVAENLPFRNGSMAGAITCFSLRDVRDREASVGEFARVVREGGRLEIVDVGKPDGPFLQRLVSLYVVLVMPIVAKFFIGGRARGNPFRMIIPTFHRLSTNRNLSRLAEREFGSSRLHEFLLGGLVIVEATQTNFSRPYMSKDDRASGTKVLTEKSATLSHFDGEKVISLETYRRNGEPVWTPVWFLKENGLLYVHTDDSTGKVKRIRRNPKVRIAPSHFRGKPKADYVDGRAELETDPETVKKYRQRIYKRYGLQGTLAKFTQGFSRSKAKDIIIIIRP